VCRGAKAWHSAILAVLAAACGHDAGVAAPVREPPPLVPPRAASSLPLVPRPRAIATCAGELAITRATRIAFEGDARAQAMRLARWLGLPPENVAPRGSAHADVELVIEPNPIAVARDPARDLPSAIEEGYTLDVSPRGAIVRGGGPAGVFYGAETLAELAGARPIEGAPATQLPRSVPCVRIADAPRFPYRGMHLDVARHFFGKDVVKRYVDLLAFYKLNVFHWHLTDDQGFRLRAAGLATEPSYADEDVREIVQYARDRFVTVVPEIEMPGHARAILAVRPDLSCTGEKQPVPTTWGIFEDILCAGNPQTIALIDEVLAHVTELFPSRIVHIGGDEVPTTRWESCPKCAARMKREGLSPARLEGAFLRDVGALLAKRGRRAAVWDEAVTTGLPDDAIVFAWRNEDASRAAIAAGHDVVTAPRQWAYFDRRQSRSSPEPGPYPVVSWSQILARDAEPQVPVDFTTPHARALGVEGAMWTEYVVTPEDLDMRLLPRLAALAETQWSETREPASFGARFAAQRPMLDAAHVRYFVEPPETPARKVFLVSFTQPLRASPLFPDGVVRYTLDGSDPTAASPSGDVVVTQTADLAASLFLPDGRTSAVARTRLEKQTPSPGRAVAGALNGVGYTYFEGDFHALPDFASLGAPKRTGRLPSLGFDASFRDKGFAVLYEAVLEAPRDDVYTCVASADDGVRLTIDDRLVVDDDGEHAPRDATGEVALAAGWHAVRVAYFQSAGGKAIAVSCRGAGPLMTPK
jgi:hexosaminidase